ncbi:hypothetical protein [Streptomyces sp. ATMOS53]
MTATVNSILSNIVLTVSVSYALLAVGYQAVQACYAWRADHHSPAYVDPMGALPSWGSRILPAAAPGGRGDDLPGNPPPARAVTDALSGVHPGIPRQATERPGREASKEGEPGWTVGSAWRS